MMNKEMMEMDIERKFGVAVSLALEFTTAIWHLVLNHSETFEYSEFRLPLDGEVGIWSIQQL